jgi:clan AA aspartic protease
VNGTVDGNGRALLPIRLRHPTTSADSDCKTWIDTAFTGHLAIPRQQLQNLGFPEGPIVSAVLADGSEVDVKTCKCLVEWFGQWRSIEVVANDGQFPLLGIALLLGRDLRIDYRGLVLTVN